jgi:hypothetical protein
MALLLNECCSHYPVYTTILERDLLYTRNRSDPTYEYIVIYSDQQSSKLIYLNINFDVNSRYVFRGKVIDDVQRIRCDQLSLIHNY